MGIEQKEEINQNIDEIKHIQTKKQIRSKENSPQIYIQ